MFRVMGLITSDRKQFFKYRSCVYCAYAGMCVWGGGGGGEVKIGLLLFGSFKDFRWYRYNLNQQMQGSW